VDGNDSNRVVPITVFALLTSASGQERIASKLSPAPVKEFNPEPIKV